VIDMAAMVERGRAARTGAAPGTYRSRPTPPGTAGRTTVRGPADPGRARAGARPRSSVGSVSTAVARSTGVLERDGELAGIEAALARARAGQGTLVVVEGQAGIGKSALIAEARARAQATGTRMLRARGAELERDFAFGLVRQLLEPALAEAPPSAHADLVQGPAGEAVRLLGLPGASSVVAHERAVAPDASFVVLHGLYWLCANLAASSPLMVTVDDAHWGDVASLRFLAFLLPRLDELAVSLLVATRPESDGPIAALLGVLLADPSAHLLRPAPLSQSAVARIVKEAFGRTPAPSFTDACHRATGGLPFLVRELVAAMRADHVVPSAMAAEHVEALGGRTVARAVALRLAQLPAPAAALARAVAVMETADLAQAAEVAGLDVDGAAGAADKLAAAGILQARRPVAFVHPIVRMAVLEDVSGAARALAHRRAAEVLASRDPGDERVAEHLLATERRGDPWTVEYLVRAARTAASCGAPESAATYLRRALAEPPPAESRSGVLLELGVAEVASGHAQGEPHLREALDSAADGQVRLGAALVLAHALGRGEQIAAAVEVIDRAAGLLADANPATRLLLESMALSAGMLDATTAPALAPRMRAMRRAADEPTAPRESLAVAALVALHANEPASTCVALARRSLAAGPRIVPDPTDLPWFAQATIALVWADALEEAQVPLDAGVAESLKTGDPGLFGAAHAQRAWLRLRRGDPQGAEGDARSVLDAAELAAPPLYRKLAAAILVEALAERGDLGKAQMVVDPYGSEIARPTHTSATLRLARGRLFLSQGRAADALADMLAAGDVALSTGSRCPGFLSWRSAAALAHLALGDSAAALGLAEKEVALARAFGAQRTLGVALRTAGAIVGGQEGEELLRESVACSARAGAALERARALAELGALLRRGNRRAESRALLREALDIAHHAGAAPLADRAETELRATGARPRRAVLTGVESLTASERRVAELAAEGLTNREIAQALFVTMRTVEGHLTSAFGKLDLQSRVELPAVLGQRA
jgi:DNA-binding CsgD family transcriptional regulator